jgi:hypothetical protein
MKRVSVGFLFLLVALFAIPILFAYGQGALCDSTQMCNPTSVSSIPELIKTILTGVLKISIPIITLAIIYAGFLFVSSQGDSNKITTAKNAFFYTVVGAGVLLGSWGLAQLASDTILSPKSSSKVVVSNEDINNGNGDNRDQEIIAVCPNPDYQESSPTGFLEKFFKIGKVLAQNVENSIEVENFTLIDENDPNKKEYYFDTKFVNNDFMNIFHNNDHQYEWSFKDKNLINRLNPEGLAFYICPPTSVPVTQHYEEINFKFTTKYPEFSFSPEKFTEISVGFDYRINKYLKSNKDFKSNYFSLNRQDTAHEILSLDKPHEISFYEIETKKIYEYGKEIVFIKIKPVFTEKTLNIFDSRNYEYVNSDMFIERQAASYFWETINIDKFITNPIYREELVNKWIKENYSAKKLIDYFRNINYLNISYSFDRLPFDSDSPHYTAHKISKKTEIVVNPLFTINNGYSLEEEDKVLFYNIGASQQSGGFDSRFMTEPRTTIDQIKKEINEEMFMILSHEYYHAVGVKDDLLPGEINPFRNIYPEVEYLWNINKGCLLLSFKDCKTLTGYVREGSYIDGGHALLPKIVVEHPISHDQAPEELKADIAAIRDYLYAKYDFDHQKSFFGEKEFNLLMNDENFTKKLIGERLLNKILGTDKDVWIKVMNIIALNDTNRNLA